MALSPPRSRLRRIISEEEIKWEEASVFQRTAAQKISVTGIKVAFTSLLIQHLLPTIRALQPG